MAGSSVRLAPTRKAASWGTVAVLHLCLFFFQAEDGIRDYKVTGVQTCALPICLRRGQPASNRESCRERSLTAPHSTDTCRGGLLQKKASCDPGSSAAGRFLCNRIDRKSVV